MHKGEGGQKERGQRNFPAARLIALRNLKRVAAAIEMDCKRARCSSSSSRVSQLYLVLLLQLPLSGYATWSLFWGQAGRQLSMSRERSRSLQLVAGFAADPQSMLKFHCIFARWLNNFFQLIFMPCHSVCHSQSSPALYLLAAAPAPFHSLPAQLTCECS